MRAFPSGAGAGQPPRALRRRTSGLALLAAVVAFVASSATADPRPGFDAIDPSGHTVVSYEPPVDAPVTDPFRPPLTPYGPGNRGIDYATVAGTRVHVAADGVVVFAGAVAGGLHVTVLHRDGVRTTYSFLAAIRVRRGDDLRGGDVVGIAAEMLHVGARRGDTYIDPASLWGQPVGPPHVHLVPLDGYQRGSPEALDRGPLGRPSDGTFARRVVALGTGAVRGAGEGVGSVPPLVEPTRTSLQSLAGPASAESAITTPAHPRSSLRTIASTCGPEDLATAGRETPPCPRPS